MFIWTLPLPLSKRLPGWLGAPSILGLGRAKKSPRVPACVRGGCVCVCVQSLFGQCPNRHRVKFNGASLTIPLSLRACYISKWPWNGLWMDFPCQSKVNQLHVQNVLFCLISDEIKSYWTSALDQHCHKLSNLCEHDVVGLDVQVEDVSHVQVLQSLNHLLKLLTTSRFWNIWNFCLLEKIEFSFLEKMELQLFGRNRISTLWKKWNFHFLEEMKFPLFGRDSISTFGRTRISTCWTEWTHLADHNNTLGLSEVEL